MSAAAFFDLDKTIVSVATEKEFGIYLYKHKKITFQELRRGLLTYFKHKLFLVSDYSKAKEETLEPVIKNRSEAEALEAYGECFETRLTHYIYPEIYSLIEEIREQGIKIYIISAAVDFIVKSFSDHLNMDGYFAQKLEVRDGLFTGRHLGKCYFGEKKAEVLRKVSKERNIDLSTSYAYGDSFKDESILSAVGNPVAVNPDRKLARIARENNWRIVRWKKPKPHFSL